MQQGGGGIEATAAQWETGGSYEHLEYGVHLLSPHMKNSTTSLFI